MRKQPLKVLTVMLTGKPVTIAEFKTTLEGEVATNRLSAYMWTIKQLGGKIKVFKEGRNVVAYQLENVEEMKDKIHREAARRLAKINAVKKEREEYIMTNTSPTKNEVVCSWVDPDFDETNNDLSSLVDPDFDETDIDDLL